MSVMAEKDIIILTGQSGLKKDNILEKIKNKADAEIVPSVEYNMKKEEDFKDILLQPPKIISQKWSTKFKEVKSELESLSTNSIKLFPLHITYFHQKKSEIFSPIDIKEILKPEFKDRVKMIVNLIDDSYDIYRRLMGKEQMYSYIFDEEISPLEALYQSIYNLLSILKWREVEKSYSRMLADLLEVPLYIVAVKHPTFMITRLFTTSPDNLKFFYLSHPITHLREETFLRLPDFYTELNMFIKKLIEKENIILFLPDTIDEKRVKKQGEMYVPELIDGWPLPYDEDWLFTPLSRSSKRWNPLNPLNFDYYSSDKNIKSSISAALEILIQNINKQIKHRDFDLVEQGKNGIIAYRCLIDGKVPRGTIAEVDYSHTLREKYDEYGRRNYIIHCREDIGRYRIRCLFNTLMNKVEIDVKTKKKLEDMLASWLLDGNIINDFVNGSIDSENIKKEIEKMLPSEYKFKENESYKRGIFDVESMSGIRNKKKSEWQFIASCSIESDPFLSLTSPDDYYITVEKEELSKVMQNLPQEISVK